VTEGRSIPGSHRCLIAVHAFDATNNKELTNGEVMDWSGTQKLGDLGDPINVTGRARLTPDGEIVYVWPYGTVQSEGYLPQRFHRVPVVTSTARASSTRTVPPSRF
jgi:hypothetical protein